MILIWSFLHSDPDRQARGRTCGQLVPLSCRYLHFLRLPTAAQVGCISVGAVNANHGLYGGMQPSRFAGIEELTSACLLQQAPESRFPDNLSGVTYADSHPTPHSGAWRPLRTELNGGLLCTTTAKASEPLQIDSHGSFLAVGMEKTEPGTFDPLNPPTRMARATTAITSVPSIRSR